MTQEAGLGPFGHLFIWRPSCPPPPLPLPREGKAGWASSSLSFLSGTLDRGCWGSASPFCDA